MRRAKYTISVALLTLSISFIQLTTLAQLPSFPGAEGWGRVSTGGRGGVVIEVTNLNDSGPGSFREACEATGARTVVFRTGGVIELLTEIQLVNPNITIAGQTAPGDGIVLKNYPISVFTHDVIIRGLRIRVGDDFPGDSPDNRDCLAIQSGSYNVIVDHCSFSWGLDENVSVLNSGVHSITIQWCIVSEALYASVHPKGFHSMGILIAYDATKTSVHHNLFAHNGGRNPLIARMTDHEFINNVVYDWKYNADLIEQGTQFKLDFIGNYYKPLTSSSYPELPFTIDFDASTSFGSKFHMVNNHFSPSLPFITPAQLISFGANAAIFSSTSLLSSPSSVIQQSANSAYDLVVADVGAGALHPKRDDTDLRVIQQVNDSTGGLIDCMDATPRLLATGNAVAGATSTTFKYSMLGKPIDYSLESRRIVITGGAGAGQTRYGLEGTPTLLDAGNLIYEGTINTPWTTVPNATSTYEFYAGCTNVLTGYPVYQSGTPATDTDHDGMPDTWETDHGLNPNSASDRNGTGLSTLAYTNLEVYLNEFYDATLITGIAENEEGISIYPNPFSNGLTIKSVKAFSDAEIVLYNLLGQEMVRISKLNGDEITFDRNQLPSGLYLLYVTEGSRRVKSMKVIAAP